MYETAEREENGMIEDRQVRLIIGSLLHDIGKIVYRSGDGRNHSQSGYEYLKNETNVRDETIINCVKYHHAKYLKNASISANDCAYVTYYADNVAAFSDRRENEEAEDGFDKRIPLDSVFNILNGNHKKAHYARQVLNPQAPINYPVEDAIVMDEHFYQTIIADITDNLKGIEVSQAYINSLLDVLEANLTYVPSSTSRRELADISLYDHVKMTAAIASCVEQYLTDEGETNYRKRLFEDADKSYKESMFLLFSMDISGIQNFIYTIAEEGALKGLRARSFYLEILMEHIVDELLDKLSLSRANLIYTGGGHCYMLLPNTETVIETLEEYEKQINEWLMEKFDIALYVACGYAEASADSLRNVPNGSYSDLYKTISTMVSGKKSHRYDAAMIRRFNQKKHDGERECKICKRVASLTDDKCFLCSALEKLSGSILYEKYFVVLSDADEDALPLPGGRYLVADTKNGLMKRMSEETYVRSYAKNDMNTGKHIAAHLWVGDYTTGQTFEELAESTQGIKRIGILRADVDNLGTTFVHGFEQEDGNDKYVTLSRTAALSRQLSLFFKCYINQILSDGRKTVWGDGGARNVVIVYSGGDDVFLAGAWNDVIAAFIDLREALTRFTLGALTISGGIGVYPDKYPINVMAKEVEQLEDASKKLDKKDGITIFDTTHTYSWHDFQEKVLGKKYWTVKNYFDSATDRGMAFLYHLTELLRDSSESINIARYVYLLSRMEPDENQGEEVRRAYREFSKEMYEWSKDSKDKKELITAIYLYVYRQRKKEDA